MAAETYGYVTQWGSVDSGNGTFNNPNGVAVDTSGYVYVADIGNDRIEKFDSNGIYQTQFGTPGSGNGQFEGPRSVAVDSSGNVYVGDDTRIQEFDSNGNYLMNITLTGYGSQNTDFIPWGLAVDTSGNIYAVDGNSVLLKFDSNGNYIANWSISLPTGVAVDTSGNVYVSQMWGNIQKNGNFLVLFGENGDTSRYPMGLAVDGTGNIYVTEGVDNRINEFDSKGNFVTQWGTRGSGKGQFFEPNGIAVDASGNVYVADSGNNRIQKFAPSQPGAITVTSEPAGAEIYLDSENTTQVTPYTFENLNPADYDVYVVLNGYSVPDVQTVDVTEGSTATADFPLHTLVNGSISVIAAINGAEIWINNVDTGHVAPFTFENMPWGSYLIEIKSYACYQMPLDVTISPADPVATADFSSCMPPMLPEFPSPVIPAIMIIGFLGAVLFIQRTREH